MARVKILSPAVRGKIAAGEVIERPVSVVKELIENSLDAQANRIEMEIKDGGKQNIIVNDDGIGMERNDALRAIERFGTSKIETLEDIEAIRTYGFRGEALASIAQVSYFELETSNGDHGTKIEVAGGQVKRITDSHRSKGTRVKVASLFYNLPARLKFLKSAQWERRLMTEMVRSYALINPGVFFSINDSGRNIFNMLGVENVKQRIKMSFPSELMDKLRILDIQVGHIVLEGFFSLPDLFSKHRLQYLYVNNRPVRYPRIYRTIMRMYEHPKHAPIFLLNVKVDPAFVDVNIHPTKNEVKFKDERYVVDLLQQALKKHILRKPGVPDSETAGQFSRKDGPESGEHFVQDSIILYDSSEADLGKTSTETDEFWQIHLLYIFAQTRSGLIIVDQHAAHERILYESMISGKGSSQRLLFPITLDLTPEDYRVYKKTKAPLQELGVEFKEFSAHTIVIDSLPTDADIDRDSFGELFRDIDGLGNLIKEKSELAKVIACHSAIKAGQKLSVLEMKNLIDRLFACKNPYICPHGRPAVIKFTLDELATKFGR